jgi:hypothetical protein
MICLIFVISLFSEAVRLAARDFSAGKGAWRQKGKSRMRNTLHANGGRFPIRLAVRDLPFDKACRYLCRNNP